MLVRLQRSLMVLDWKKSPVHQILGICPRNFWAEPLLNIYLSIRGFRGFLHKKIPDFESTDKTPPRRVPLHQESSLSERFFRVFSCFLVLVTGSGPRWKKRENAKTKKSRPVVERWWGSLILWWLQNEKVEKMHVRGCVTCIRERVYVLNKKMNMELSNVRKWLVYFREMIQWAQKNTLTDAFIVQAIIFGDVYTVYIPPKKTGITKPTLRNFGRPTVRGYQIYSPKWYPRSTPWCPKVASSGLVQESISCPGTYACWFKGKKNDKKASHLIDISRS